MQIEWPPEYTVKKHPRAKHVKLKISEEKGLELTVPLRFNLKEIPAILNEHEAWIHKQFLALQKIKKPAECEVPKQIELLSVAKTIRIQYIPIHLWKKTQLVAHAFDDIVMMGDIKNSKRIFTLLKQWLKHEAKKILETELKKLSQQTGLTFNSMMIRDQRSRWGSCSSTKDISLNYKLILLPRQLMLHILIHELAHTVHLDHSDKFWRLVKKWDPDVELHKKMLKKADEALPRWLLN